MRWLVPMLVIAGLAAGTGPARADGDAPPVPVSVLVVAAEQVAEGITLRGRTMPERSVTLEAETDGRVISAPLRKGARVETGTVLCRLDPGSRPAQLAEAEAALTEARAEAEAAESLSAKGFTAETTRFARQAALQAAAARVELVRLDISRLEIRAPFDGWLETDTAELGSRLSPGEPCATLVDLSRLRATAYVGERRVGALAPGQSAEVRLVDDQTAEGRITHVARVADPQTRTYEVEVTVENPGARLRAGMTAEIEVGLAPRRAHLVPQSALTLDDAGRLGLRLAVDGIARFAPVEIVAEAARGVWVTGLADRARVIVAGQEFVRDGRPVEAREIARDELG